MVSVGALQIFYTVVEPRIHTMDTTSIRLTVATYSICCTLVVCAGSMAAHAPIPFRGVHHVGLLVEDLNRSLDFYCGTLGAIRWYACLTVTAYCHTAMPLIR